MKIEVVDIDDLDQAALGWRWSRNLKEDVTWHHVFDVDVPVNEFPSVLLSLKDMTIFEREIFASPRNHVMWARTSHVDDPLEFVVPEELNVPAWTDMQRSLMDKGKAAGQSQDEWRVHLPIMSQTAWTSRINFRDLVKLTMYIKHVAIQTTATPLLKRTNNLYREMLKVIDQFTYDRALTEKVCQAYSPARYLHEGPIVPGPARQETSGMFVLYMRVPLWLRAQIVRHRNLTFVDNFWRKIVRGSYPEFITINEPIDMEIAATKDVWRSIMSKRSCWIAQDSLKSAVDPWQKIVDSFGWTPEMLPCHDGKCPYHKDANNRLDPKVDPGAPCPRYLNINNIDQTLYRERIEVGLASRHSYWREQVR